MAFPTSPNNGQIYKNYKFNSSSNIWEKDILVAKTVRSTSAPSYSGRRLASHTSYSNTNFIPADVIHNNGNCFNTSNGEFTCPITGKYLVMWQGLVYTNYVSTGHAYISFYVNSTEKTLKAHTMYNISRKYEPVGLTAVVHANVGDKITCKITTESATIWGGSGAPHCCMSICFVN